MGSLAPLGPGLPSLGRKSASLFQKRTEAMSKLDPALPPAQRISGLPAVEYHALRALSASGAWLLAEECAAKFLWRSPWNPLYVPEAKTDFDIGVAAHLAVLEPHRHAD